jgi:phosphate transport system substrate-binding protein
MIPQKWSLYRILGTSVATLVLSVASLSVAVAANLKGAGATFPAPLYQRYFTQLQQDKNITVNYEAVGSGAGIERFMADTVDFAGTDAPPTESQMNQMSAGMVRVPTAGGAVAVVFNIPGVSQLNLSRDVLAGIFLGKITNWNDRKIAKNNPGINLPDLPIKPVVRADGSGTTYIFTRHLSAINPTFKKQVNVSTQPNWPGSPLKAEQTEGVATTVKQTSGTIGYVQDTYARQNQLPTALVENITGQFIEPSLEKTNEALSNVRFYQDFSAANLKDPDSGYPIIGVTWILVKKQYETAEKATAIQTMVNWIMESGQGLNETLGYTRIPDNIATDAVEMVKDNVASNP